MNEDEVKSSEAYWTKAVADFMKLGMKEAIVPLASLNSDSAKAIAEKLNVRLEVRGTDYVFHQDMANKLIQSDEQQGRNTELEENFSHFENNNGNF